VNKGGAQRQFSLTDAQIGSSLGTQPLRRLSFVPVEDCAKEVPALQYFPAWLGPQTSVRGTAMPVLLDDSESAKAAGAMEVDDEIEAADVDMKGNATAAGTPPGPSSVQPSGARADASAQLSAAANTPVPDDSFADNLEQTPTYTEVPWPFGKGDSSHLPIGHLDVYDPLEVVKDTSNMQDKEEIKDLFGLPISDFNPSGLKPAKPAGPQDGTGTGAYFFATVKETRTGDTRKAKFPIAVGTALRTDREVELWNFQQVQILKQRWHIAELDDQWLEQGRKLAQLRDLNQQLVEQLAAARARQ